MGFDFVDRQFQPAPPKEIKLECTACGTTDEVASVPGEDPLCAECRIHQHFAGL